MLVGSNFGQTGPGIPGDINQDEVVNIIDLVLVGSHFGEVFAPTAAAPPPANRGAQAEVSMTAGQSTQTRQGVQERLITVEVNADSTLPLGGFMFDVGYDPYLLALVDLQEGTLLKRDGTRSFWLEPKFQPGRVAKIASIALAGHSEGTALTTKADTLTEITFRLKGDIDDALESIQIQNLALSDRDAQSIPFRLDGRIRYDRQPAPLTYSLNQNYPNPFNPETWIPYQLANPGEVTLRIYDASGHLVRTLHLGFQSAGAYQSRDKAAYWDGRNMNGEKVASGIYFYQIEAGQFSATRKMVIVK